MFFSAQHPASQPANTEYSFIAALEVESLTSHEALWASSRYSNLRRYLNLLIKPHGSGWDHFEPAVRISEWHRDWMWRLCARRGLRKADVILACTSHAPGAELLLRNQRLPVANNYVVFSRTSQITSRAPLLVATYAPGASKEQWLPDSTVSGLHDLVFAGSPRGFRTSNRQQPHRHFRRPLSDPGSWLAEVRDLTSRAETRRGPRTGSRA